MFSDEFLQFDVGTLAFVTRDEAQSTYARKSDIPTLAGGLDLTLADARYAPKTGSTTYALKSEIPDISGKANITDVGNALLGKADAAHTHTGVYAPTTHTHADYATRAEIPDVSGKANVSDVTTALATKASVTDVTAALAGKADAGHTHAGVYAPQSTTYTKTEVDTALAVKSDVTHVHSGIYQPVGNYAPATGSTEYATKAEVVQATGGGLTQAAGDARYLQLTNVFTEVTDIGDQAYAPINNSLVYATKTEIPDVSGKANVTDVAAALATKADAGHTHDGTYAPVSTTYTKTQVDTALAGKSDTTHTHDGVYQPVGNYATVNQLNDVSAEVMQWAPADRNVPIDTQFAPYNLEEGTDGQYALVGHTHSQYAPQSGTYTKTEVDTALTGKSNTTHNHDGTYAPVNTTYTKTEVDGLLAGLSAGGGGAPTYLSATSTNQGSLIAWSTPTANTSPLTLMDSRNFLNNTTKTVVVAVFAQTHFNSDATGMRGININKVAATYAPYNASKMYYADQVSSPTQATQLYETRQTAPSGNSYGLIMQVQGIVVLEPGAWFGYTAGGIGGPPIAMSKMNCLAWSL